MKKDKQRDISMLTLPDLITQYYPRIKELASMKAYKYYIPYDDLINETHQNISRASSRSQFTGQTEGDFIAWLDQLMSNSAINVKRLQKRRAERNVSLDNDDEQFTNSIGSVNQTCSSSKVLLKNICVWAEKTYSKHQNKNYTTVFTRRFIQEASYMEIADELEIPINSVKSIVFTLRKGLIAQFQTEYRQVINN